MEVKKEKKYQSLTGERSDDLRPQPAGEHIDIPLEESRPERTIKVGTAAFERLGADLHLLLKEFKDIFAFEVEEMPDINPDLAVHKLVVDPKKKPIRQKKRNHGEERSQAAAAEIKKLLDARFIRPCNFPIGWPMWSLSRNRMGPGACV